MHRYTWKNSAFRWLGRLASLANNLHREHTFLWCMYILWCINTWCKCLHNNCAYNYVPSILTMESNSLFWATSTAFKFSWTKNNSHWFAWTNMNVLHNNSLGSILHWVFQCWCQVLGEEEPGPSPHCPAPLPGAELCWNPTQGDSIQRMSHACIIGYVS